MRLLCDESAPYPAAACRACHDSALNYPLRSHLQRECGHSSTGHTGVQRKAPFCGQSRGIIWLRRGAGEKMSKLFRDRRLRAARLACILVIVALTAAVLACAGAPDAPPGAVHVLTAKGTVNPVMDRYLDRGISAAEDEDAGAVVGRLNTGGGLSSSMDDIVQRIIRARVPVVVYVWPAGGQAASAGTFITYASHLAAMAPGTVIGSATPIDSSGGDIEGDLGNKVKENAAAKI